MRLICGALTVWYSLRTWNPWTALGWVVVDGHAYADEDGGIRCERCGRWEAERIVVPPSSTSSGEKLTNELPATTNHSTTTDR